MKLFEGKTSTERNKIIAAGVLGVIALLSLYFAFGHGSSSTTATSVTVKTSPTPRTATGPVRPDAVLPTRDEQDFIYQTTPIVYSPGSAGAPDAGRNIFAFYEPPPPCNRNVPGDCPPPPPPKPSPIPTPSPVPTPKIFVSFMSPQNVYAGSKGFVLEMVGERIPANAKVYFNQADVPTRVVDGGRLAADIPASAIAREGQVQVLVQTPDGTAYSNQMMFNVQAPPKPTFQYIGMIGRTRYNNDTAYFLDPNRGSQPFGARLNDVVAGRFRLINISPAEVVFEDTSLGFKHRVPITKAATGITPGQPVRGQPDGFVPFNPGDFPSIPNNQRIIPVQPQPRPTAKPPDTSKPDVDDDGDG